MIFFGYFVRLGIYFRKKFQVDPPFLWWESHVCQGSKKWYFFGFSGLLVRVLGKISTLPRFYLVEHSMLVLDVVWWLVLLLMKIPSRPDLFRAKIPLFSKDRIYDIFRFFWRFKIILLRHKFQLDPPFFQQ